MTENGRFVRTGWLIAILTAATIGLLSAWGRSIERRVDEKQDKSEAVQMEQRLNARFDRQDAALDRFEGKLDRLFETRPAQRGIFPP